MLFKWVDMFKSEQFCLNTLRYYVTVIELRNKSEK